MQETKGESAAQVMIRGMIDRAGYSLDDRSLTNLTWLLVRAATESSRLDAAHEGHDRGEEILRQLDDHRESILKLKDEVRFLTLYVEDLSDVDRALADAQDVIRTAIFDPTLGDPVFPARSGGKGGAPARPSITLLAGAALDLLLKYLRRNGEVIGSIKECSTFLAELVAELQKDDWFGKHLPFKANMHTLQGAHNKSKKVLATLPDNAVMGQLNSDEMKRLRTLMSENAERYS